MGLRSAAKQISQGCMQVFEAAVIGKPHKKWGEPPLLVIVPAPGTKPSKDSVLGFLKVCALLLLAIIWQTSSKPGADVSIKSCS